MNLNDPHLEEDQDVGRVISAIRDAILHYGLAFCDNSKSYSDSIENKGENICLE